MKDHAAKQLLRKFVVSCTILSILLCIFAGLPGSSLLADEQAELESLLNRLNLTELQIIHLEDKLLEQNDTQQESQLAEKLASSYIEVLLSSAEDEDKFADYIARVRQLIAKRSEIDSPSLQVMLLQAEYVRSEKLVMQWIDDQSKTDALLRAGEILARVVPKFAETSKELNATIDRLNDQLDEDDSDELDQAVVSLVDQLTQVHFRATYFNGWSNYYLAISQRALSGKTIVSNEIAGDEKAAIEKAANEKISDETASENRQGGFVVARDCFAEIVGVQTELDYDEQLSADWLQLNSVWIARSLMGLGMAEIGLGNQRNGQLCFRLLASPSTNASLRRQSGYWHMQGLLNAGDYAIAGTLAKKFLSADSPLSESQRAGICVGLVRTAFSSPLAKSKSPMRESTETTQTVVAFNADLQALGSIGVSGLMNLRRFPQLIAVLDELDVSIPSNDFYSWWLTGYRQFLDAEKAKSQKGYRSAAIAMSKAIGLPAASLDVKSLAVCRYHLAWIRFRQEQFDPAQELLQTAIPTLKQIDPELAVQAAWLRYESLAGITKTDKRTELQLLEQLQDIIREYPGTQFARNAEYQLARQKRKSSTPDQVARDLEAISRDNPNFLNARYEVCLVYHQLWQEKRTDVRVATEISNKLFPAIDLFLSEAKDQRHPQRLRVALIAIDVCLRSQPQAIERGQRYLQVAEEAEVYVPSGSTSVIEYHYQTFQLARLTGDRKAAEIQTEWLAANGSGTAYQKSAVIQLAKSIDQKIATTLGEQRLEHIRRAIGIYKQMVELFGDSTARLKRDKNARVALSRLAGFQSEMKRFNESAENMEKLVTVFPSDRGYLQKCGEAQFRAGNYERSLVHFRILSKGLENGSEEWFQARYYLLYSLAKTDTESAREVFGQFEKLHPELPDKWSAKFDEVRSLVTE